MSTRRTFLLWSLGLTGGALLGAGCGSGSGREPILPGPTPSPSPSPAPSGAPPAAGDSGDFDIALAAGAVERGLLILDAAGAGSLPLVLRSVRGFGKPVALAITSVTARDPSESSVPATGVTARLTPSALTSLPAGDTPVTLSVEGAASLPPLSQITVDFSAEGDGLSRYLFDSVDRNSNRCRFVVPGIVLPTTLDLTVGGTGSNVPSYLLVEAAGRAGTLEVRFEGLPAGLEIDPVTIPVTGLPDKNGQFLYSETLAFRAASGVVAGEYPARLLAYLDGALAQSQAVTLTVRRPSAPPELSLRYEEGGEEGIMVARGQSVRVPVQVTVSRRGGTLTFAADRLPPGVVVTFDDPSLPLTADRPAQTAWTFAATTSAVPGAQEVRLEAELGDLVFPIRKTITVT
jgi:hypothetical protein